MTLNKLSPFILIVPICIILGATAYGFFKLNEVKGFKQYPIVAVVNNSLGIKPKLKNVIIKIKDFQIKPTTRNFKNIASSYKVYRASILNDLQSQQSTETHLAFGDPEIVNKFVNDLRAIENLLPVNKADQKNTKLSLKELNRIYQSWNIYSRRFVQNTQVYHHQYVVRINESLEYILVLLLIILFTSGFASFLMYRQYKSKLRLNNALQEQTLDLMSAKDQAEQGTREKSRFLANMSHEIRTPLNGIIGLSHLAFDKTSDQEIKRYLSKINHSGDMLLGLVSNILDISKIESGKLSLEFIEFDLWTLFDDVSGMISESAREKDLYFNLNISPTVPRFIVSDPTRLSQILINLCGNSIKFTQDGGVEIFVDSYPEGNRNNLTVSIKDTGIGISESAKNNIFTEFSQEDDSTTRQFGGTGLGLSICLNLIKAMDGSLNLISEKGKGSEFIFEIPLNQFSMFDYKSITDNFYIKSLVNDRSMNEAIMQNLDQWEINGRSLENINNDKITYLCFSDKGLSESDLKLINSSRSVILLCFPEFESEVVQGINVPYHVIDPPFSSFKLVKSIIKLSGKGDTSIVGDAAAAKNETLLNGKQVLVVEDNPINQIVSQEMMESLGAVVTLSANGVECLKALKEKSFDLIFMDIHMPVMDGMEATKAIRAMNQYKALPIIAFTANVMKEDVDHYYEIGMNGCIPKPFNELELISIVKKVMEF